MLGTGLQFGRSHVEDRFYNPVKARRNQHHYPPHSNQIHKPKTSNGGLGLGQGQGQGPVVSTKGKSVILDNIEPENRTGTGSEELSKPVAVPASSEPAPPVLTPLSNLDRFLEYTTPSVPAQYISTKIMRGRTCDVEYQPYFVLDDLWESFKEWSAYGAGVPLVLNDNDCVVQYYVPYLSGIQIYGESTTLIPNSRRHGEDSDGDYYRDSSSDGSSECDLSRLKYSKDQWNRSHQVSEVPLRVDRLSQRDNHITLQEGSSSDDGETGGSRGRLLFEFLEKNSPFCREPLADKILDLARRSPQLKTLRSCDLLASSWISVAWYPIYRIPTGPTLRDLDACFLTFHSLSTPMRGAGTTQGPIMTYPNGTDGVHKISLPVFGLASYKLKGPMWIPGGSCVRQLSNSLLQAADNWLRLLEVNHPDFQFFASHGACRR